MSERKLPPTFPPPSKGGAPEWAQYHPADTSLPALLVREEQNALRRLSPRRNRWRDLQAFEERLIEIEQRRSDLLAELAELNQELANEPERHVAAVAEWIATGSEGEQPSSRTRQLEEQIADRKGEYDGYAVLYDRLLGERADTSPATARSSSATPPRRSRRRPRSTEGTWTRSRRSGANYSN